MLNSSTGQAVGVLLPYWSYIPTDRISPKGLLYPVSQIMKEGNLLRFVMLVGGAKEEVSMAGKDFFWSDVNKMYLPEYCLIDITAKFRDRICTFTGLYAGKDGLFVNGKKAGSFKDISSIFAHYGLSEVWNLITGDIRPSCGVYRYGRLFVPETEVCLGLISERANFPKGYDMKDLGRVERILEDAGVFEIPEEISLADVEEKLSKFAEVEKILDGFADRDEETLLR
jgi:hypothetical protein